MPKTERPMAFNTAFVHQAVRDLGSQAELARAAGVSREAVRLWADGVNRPTQKQVDAIAAEVGLDPAAAWSDAVLPTEPLPDLFEVTCSAAHISLRRLAEATGIPLGTLSEIKNGKRQAGPKRELAIREFVRDNVPSTAGRATASSWAARERGRRPTRRVQMNLSDDVLKFFRLKNDPWRLDVTADRDVFPTRDFRRMHNLVVRAIERLDFAVVSAPTGAGKSEMARRILREIDKRKRVKLVHIWSPNIKQINSSSLCDALVKNLGPGDKPQVRQEKLAIQVCEILVAHQQAGNIPVIVIDDAHRCTPSTLSQLKRFWEFRAPGSYRPLLGIVLLGWPELSLTLRNNAALLEVARRVDMVELRGLAGEHGDYIRKKLQRVGANGRVAFAPAALKAFSRIPQAQWPLAVNRIASRAMRIAFDVHKSRPKKDHGQVLADDVKRAAQEVV